MTHLPTTGPNPDEFTDFEQASKPRRRPLTADHLLEAVIVIAFVLLLIVLVTASIRWFQANTSDRRILGSWQALDHPEIANLYFGKSHDVTIIYKDGNTLYWRYQFLAQHTIDIGPQETQQPGRRYKVHFDGSQMTMEDTSDGKISHWRR
jgi:hypothetical protein